MDHLRAEEAAAQFAAHPQAGAFGHQLGLAAVEINEPQRQLAGIVGNLDHHLAARAQADLVGGDHALDLHRQPHARAPDGIGDRQQRGLVLVAHRQVQHQIDVALEPELMQPGHGRGRLAGGSALGHRLARTARLVPGARRGRAVVGFRGSVGSSSWHLGRGWRFGSGRAPGGTRWLAQIGDITRARAAQPPQALQYRIRRLYLCRPRHRAVCGRFYPHDADAVRF